MSWKRHLAEAAVGGAARLFRTGPAPAEPASILVLRNNDIGDLLVVTPLFEALRRRFPRARITAAIGPWNREVLRGNPHLSDVIELRAPWHNKVLHPQGPGPALRYLASSDEARRLAQEGFDTGIDVLGSPWGALLLLRARIPRRLGMRGYAGGHSATHATVAFNPQEHVGRSALRFAELLGARSLPVNRPQLFLTPEELADAESRWQALAPVTGGANRQRLVLGPGAGHAAKAWPANSWVELAARLAASDRYTLIVVGGAQDRALGDAMAAVAPGLLDLTGLTPLRQTFALAARADCVLCHSSMLLHAAAAAAKPAVVLLGDHFPSATAHARQWGYGPETVFLGHEPGRARLPTVGEVVEQVKDAAITERIAA